MKKLIYSLLVMAMAAFTFSSCEDVPAPYDTPKQPETPETPTIDPAGTGTQADPFNVAGAVKYIEDGGSEDAEVYVKGKVVSVREGSYDANYGSLKYYISDDGTSNNQFYVFNGYAGPNRTKFSGEDALKAGDEVVICGKLVNYNGTQEFTTGNYVVTLNGKPLSGTDTPDTPTPEPGDGMNLAALISGKTGSNTLPSNSYPSQDVNDPATWYTWKYDGIDYQGVRICQATEANGGGIQIQGNASDATKQGFFFNSTAFSKDIKSITIVVRSASKYDTPTVFNVYGGTEAHPVTTAIEGTYTKVTEGDFNIFTFTYDFSAVSNQYFTVWNNAVGVLYIDKVEVALK